MEAAAESPLESETPSVRCELSTCFLLGRLSGLAVRILHLLDWGLAGILETTAGRVVRNWHRGRAQDVPGTA